MSSQGSTPHPHEAGPHRPGRPGHEQSDVRVRLILLSALVLAAGFVPVHLLLLWVFGQFSERAERSDPPVSPLSVRPEPPPPRLEPAPARDLDEYLAAERRILDSYGWVDQERQIVRIPIERAIDLLIQRGLPVPVQPEQPARPDAEGAGEPSPPRRSEPPGQAQENGSSAATPPEELR